MIRLVSLSPKLFDMVMLSPDANDIYGPLRNGVESSAFQRGSEVEWLHSERIHDILLIFTASLKSQTTSKLSKRIAAKLATKPVLFDADIHQCPNSLES